MNLASSKQSVENTFKRFKFNSPEKFAFWSKSAASDRNFVIFAAAWFMALFISLVVVLLSFQALPTQIPLFYSRVWGEQQLAAKSFIFLPLLGTLLLGLFNFTTGINFHSQSKIIAYLLAGTASLISILSAITVINIIRLMA